MHRFRNQDSSETSALTSMNLIYLAVGSNLGDRKKNIEAAEQKLKKNPKVKFLRASPIYETEPVGGSPQEKYLNAVWEIETGLSPNELLRELLSIEESLGRKREIKNGPRTIDLDILFYNDLIMNGDHLTIPHPRLRDRWFVLKPLWDLRSDLVHPVFGKSVCELLDECRAGH